MSGDPCRACAGVLRETAKSIGVETIPDIGVRFCLCALLQLSRSSRAEQAFGKTVRLGLKLRPEGYSQGSNVLACFSHSTANGVQDRVLNCVPGVLVRAESRLKKLLEAASRRCALAVQRSSSTACHGRGSRQWTLLTLTWRRERGGPAGYPTLGAFCRSLQAEFQRSPQGRRH